MNMDGQPVLPGMEPLRYQIEDAEHRRDYVPVRCAICEKEMTYDEHQNASCGEEATQYEGDPICETCYCEDEAEATLRVFDADNPEGEGDYGTSIFEIGSCKNMTACDGDIGTWRTKWVRTDAWRGYIDLIPPKDWVQFHSDCSLMGSEDSAMLEKYDASVRKAFIAKGVRLIRATLRTSNCCSAGVDYFVEKKFLKWATAASRKLADVFRDPVRFNMTAITGKDPASAGVDDYVVAALGAKLLGGK